MGCKIDREPSFVRYTYHLTPDELAEDSQLQRVLESHCNKVPVEIDGRLLDIVQMDMNFGVHTYGSVTITGLIAKSKMK